MSEDRYEGERGSKVNGGSRSRRSACSRIPRHDFRYNPTSSKTAHWWANSASCTIWQGVGKERKIALCDSPQTAAMICRLQWGALDSANASHHQRPEAEGCREFGA